MTFKFIIRLAGFTNPEVWRRIEIPSNFSFFKLYQAITVAFGKPYENPVFAFTPLDGNSTLRILSINNPLHDDLYAKTTLLSSHFKYRGQTFVFRHDLDERLTHHIVLEHKDDRNIADVACIAGDGAYPPEFMANSEDYNDMKIALSDTNHPSHRIIRDWLELEENETWEEKYKFDLHKVNEQMSHIDDKMKSFRNYTIVSHNTFDEQYGLSPSLWKIIDRKRDEISSNFNLNRTIKELQKLIQENPAIPHFKNSLASAYYYERDLVRYLELIQQIIQEYPDYTMSRSGLAHHYIRTGKMKKCAELLGKHFSLSALYPNRNGRFSETEIFNYHIVVASYLIKAKKHDEAKKHFDYLEFVNPLQLNLPELRLNLAILAMNNFKKEKKNRQTVEVIPEQVAQTDKMPDFEHPEIKVLFEHDFDINRDVIRQLMNLPRASLVRDLEKVLIDSISRFKYYREHKEEEFLFAPAHALSMLATLQAEEALDTLFIVMRQDDDYYTFWFDLLITEAFWQFILAMGQNRLDRLKDFIKEPNRYTYVRTAVSHVLFHIAYYQQERKDEVLQWYKEVIQYQLDHRNDKHLFDSEVYISLLEDMCCIAGKEHLPVIINLLDDQFAKKDDRSIHDLKVRLAKPAPGYLIYKLLTSIDQYYDKWKKMFENDDQHESNFEESGKGQKSTTSNDSPKKVGRNELCPCGSGKKYKKCCGAT